MKTTDYPELEIDTSVRRQHREWIIQRIALLLFVALLACIALGLLGRGGPLSTVDVNGADGSFRLEYQRFIRHHSSDTLDVTVRRPSRSTSVKLDAQYLSHVQIEQVTPQPEHVIAEGGALVYVFNARGDAPFRVSFQFEPQMVGGLNGWVAAGDAPALHFSQFVYP